MPTTSATDLQQIVPLCVDLDGTLIRSDLLWESLVQLLRHNPFYAFILPFWWLRGRANLKAQIASRVEVDVALLPYHVPLIDFLRAEKNRGRPIFLVTASDSRLAQRVAEHLGLFDDVMASDGKTNLRGKNKGKRLAERFGKGAFDYAGNSSVDLPVWQAARQAIVVNGTPKLVLRASRLAALGQPFESRKSWWQPLGRALRLHQWVKNLIIFVPLLTSHHLTNPVSRTTSLVAFIAFSLCASAVYVLNDLLDVDSDRHHPTKKLRPFASGDLPLAAGLVFGPILLVASAAVAWSLPATFSLVLIAYLALTTGYSWRLKQIPLLDVFCLAGLYTIRLVAGHEATGIAYSFWLLLFSMFIFLSLALVKRFIELDVTPQSWRESRPPPSRPLRGGGPGGGRKPPLRGA